MTRWVPDDQELDGVARELPPPTVDPDRIEQTRTSLLARATLAAPLAARSWSMWLAAGTALAAAAVVVLWLAVGSRGSSGSKDVIFALGPASYERIHDWPDFVVHLTEGRIEVRVAALATDERFRIVTGDAELEVRATSFEVRAEHDRLLAVRVQIGRAELRLADQRVVVLASGESWNATAIARAELVPEVAPAPPIVPPPRSTPRPHMTTHASATAVANLVPAPPPAPAPAPALATARPAPSALPGEVDFRAGWAALRANDAAAAAGKFDSACTAAIHTALGEDACFWAGAAAKRANDPARARIAIDRFIASFPASSRAGEASALLGWILLDAGDSRNAESAFHRAEQDRVPRVRDSAAKGLAALRAKQR